MELKKQNTKVTKCKKFKHYQIQKEKIKLPQYKCNKIQMQQNTNGTKSKKLSKYKHNKIQKYKIQITKIQIAKIQI